MSLVFFAYHTYHRLRKTRRVTQLLILTSFLFSFIATRAITHLQRAGHIPTNPDEHMHHLIPGIVLALISGYMGMSFWNKKKIRYTMAILFGMGAALILDEFALGLFLKDVYWTEQGENSINAVIVATIFLTIAFITSEAHEHKWFKRSVD